MKRALSAVQKFALCLAVAACANVVEPIGPVHVRAPDVITMSTDPGPLDLRFSVPIEITNGGPQTLVHSWCSWRLEKLIDGAWITAVTPFCAAIDFPADPEILPGATLTTSVWAYQSWFVMPAGSIPGTYRAVLFLHTKDGEPVPLSDGTSNSFDVTQ
jgi:hypothetical protein